MAGSDSLAVRRLAGELDKLGRRVGNLERPVGLGHSAIESGSIDTYDGDQLVGRTGTQHDGTHGSVVLDGPIPPVPSAPLVTGGPAQAVVTWDGTFVGDARVPLDYQTMQVFAAVGRDPEPVFEDLIGVIASEAGVSTTLGLVAGDYRFALRTRSQAGRHSALSASTEATVLSVMDAEVVAELERQITDATERLDDVGAEVLESGQTLQDLLDGAFQVGSDAAGAAAAAGTTAGQALTAAQQAAGAASSAQGTADAATTAASTAAQAAADAAGIAGGKADVLIQAAAPSVAMRKVTTLWIDTTSAINTPKRWSGTAWVAVTDKAATDAATAAAAAASAAAAAQARADAAHALAGDANTNANLAMASANGKNSIARSTAVPAGNGKVAGDTWMRFSDGTFTTVVGQWTWSGTAWQQMALSHQVISSVDIGSLTVVGTAVLATAVIDKLWADVVRSRKMTTDMLLVGSGANLLVDPFFTDKAAWTGSALVQATGGRLSGGCLLIPQGSTQAGSYNASGTSTLQYASPVEEGKKYRVGGWVRFDGAAPTAATRATLYARYYNPATGTFDGSAAIVSNAAGVAADTWTWIEGVATIPAGRTHMSVGCYKQATHTVGPVRFDGLVVNNMTDASLLVDGGILARHITASEEMWTKVLGAHKVTALEIETGELAADNGFIAALTAASAFIERVRALGIRIEDADGDPVIDLTSTGPNYLQLYGAGGQVVASMSQDGGVFGRTVAASQSLTYQGEELSPLLDKRGRSIVGWGFASASQVNPSQGQEMGILEIGFTAQAGRMYVLHCTEVPFFPIGAIPATTDSSTTVRLRYTTDGSRPVVTSPLLNTWQCSSKGANVRSVSPSEQMMAGSDTVDQDFRLLITHQASGWNTAVAEWAQLYFYVEDVGPNLARVGGPSDGGGSSAPIVPPTPIRRYTKQYPMAWWRSYGTAGNPAGGGTIGGSYIAQGKSPYAPDNFRSLFGFGPQVQADLAGATVEDVQVFMHAVHWNNNGGGTAQFGMHGFSAAPAAFDHNPGGILINFGKPDAKWWRLPGNLYPGLKSGQYRGLSLLAPSTAAQYYGYFGTSGGSTPLLEITYTK